MPESKKMLFPMHNILVFDDFSSALKDFNDKALKTKQHIIDKAKEYIKMIDYKKMLNNLSDFSKSIVISSLNRLIRRIKYKVFPDLSNQSDFCSYVICILEGKIQIRFQRIEFSDEYKQWMFIEYGTIYECETVLYSVNEYANLHNVAVTTVREWIRRGKLDTAIKKGLEWFIPALTEPADRSSEKISFERITYDDNLTDEPLIKQDARFINIVKIKNKSEYLISFLDDNNIPTGGNYLRKKEMMRVRRRLLESYDFISSANKIIFLENY